YLLIQCQSTFTLFPYTTLFRSVVGSSNISSSGLENNALAISTLLFCPPDKVLNLWFSISIKLSFSAKISYLAKTSFFELKYKARSEEHTSELQSRENLVCRLLL